MLNSFERKRRNKCHEKRQIKIIKLKSTTRTTNVHKGLNSRMEMTEDRSNEHEDKQIQFIQSEQQRESTLK